MSLSLERIYTRQEVVPVANEIVDRLLEEQSSKEALSKIFIVGKIISEADSRLRALAVDQIDGKKETIQGVEFLTRNLVKVWDYTDCNDSKLLELGIEMTKAEKKLDDAKKDFKQRQLFLQNLPSPIAIVSTGEMINPAKLQRSGVTLVVQFPKEE